MNRGAAVTLRFVTAGCLLAFWLSATPGGLERWALPAFLLALLASPFVLISLPFLGVAALRARKRSAVKKPADPDPDPAGDAVGTSAPPPGPRRPWWASALLGLAVLAASAGIIAARLPMRLAFAASRSAFEASRAGAPRESGRHGFPLGRRLGYFYVDRYAADPRGGVYFRTGTSPDVIDTVSHGFVYRPNAGGTPFGRSGYRYGRIAGDWFVFSASDDAY